MTARLLTGDALAVMQTLPDASVRCCVTSPPYWGLRDYGVSGQLGLERTPEEYVAKMVGVFREVRRVLADDGTLWLNLGDSYCGGGRGGNPENSIYDKQRSNAGSLSVGPSAHVAGMKPKDLVGIPWLLAFALRADGWYLRSDIIWHKPNPMPESVTDRPTKSHEYLFLLSKAERYYYNADAIAEPLTTAANENYPGRARVTGRGQQSFNADGCRAKDRDKSGGYPPRRSGNKERKAASARGVPVDTNGSPNGAVAGSVPWEDDGLGRNARSVWTIATKPYSGAHFATFPEELAARCIKAGSAPSDTVLDPFSGSGTVAAVAIGLGRNALGIELNPKYQELARQRIGPMFCEVA